eukprot:GHVL01042715.1.p2 GENE.GHVL01042715.1~~GHVL01042715.1.p2  ORF type:complete len:163 (-),score=26.46 GHVL01042715.1:1552-2019(-)
MKSQNRPYSAINVADNLRGAVTKSQVPKIMESLGISGKLIMKQYGKFKVFLTPQESIIDPSDIDKLRELISEVSDKLSEEVSRCSELKVVESKTDTIMTTAEVCQMINSLENEISKTRIVLEQHLQNGNCESSSINTEDIPSRKRYRDELLVSCF